MRGTGPAGLLGAITGGLARADVALGAPLMQQSLLGYDPVAGSRYYGIGNEYMGVLIGAALMGSGWLIDRLSARSSAGRIFSWAFAGLFAGLTLLMIHPRFGINVGGAITAAGTAMAGLLFLAQRPLTLWTAVVGGAVVVLLVASAAWLDAYFMGDEASHLGQVVQTVNESGTDPLWALFGRKAAINLRLIRLTVWSRVVFVAAGLSRRGRLYAQLVSPQARSALSGPCGHDQDLRRREPGRPGGQRFGCRGGSDAPFMAGPNGLIRFA